MTQSHPPAPRARIIVIGAGPAGLIAAARAAECAPPGTVLLLEKMARPGRKILLTGNGRCNLTHDAPPTSFLAHVHPSGQFLRNALARFGPSELRARLAEWGLPTRQEPDGRVYPDSERSYDVLRALMAWARRGGVLIKANSEVREILVGRADAAFVRGVRLGDGSELDCLCAILCTGGLSYPATGSTGDGYRLAASCGHTVVTPRPGLVPLVVQEGWAARLQGVSLRDVRGALRSGDLVLATGRGDVLFTHYGLSGPLVLDLSNHLVPSAPRGLHQLDLDLLPDLSEGDLDTRLRRDMASHGRACYDALLRDYVPRALARILAEQGDIAPDLPLAQWDAAQRRRLGRLLKRLTLTIAGTRPMEEAMVTLGGISTPELDPRTLGSRLVRGLYCAGEVIDLGGDTGGYNLQIAFTTGYVAGENAAQGVTACRDQAT